ncbi:hypothetical protein GCM10009605_27610 [Nocardiopsis composta]
MKTAASSVAMTEADSAAADGPVHRRAWGIDGRGEPVTAETPFLWGSAAKPAAASSVLVLAQEGRLGLDDPVTEYLPDFRFGGAEHASRVTVGHLLAQTAGIPASATFAVADRLGPDQAGPAERTAEPDGVRPLGPPGTAYAYSSANYLVLTAVVEAATGRPFADHLTESVLGPAGMPGAVTDRASAAERGLAPGHQPMWGVPAPIADEVDGDGAAYGYLGGDLDDLAAFAAFQLRARGAPPRARPSSPRSRCGRCAPRASSTPPAPGPATGWAGGSAAWTHPWTARSGTPAAPPATRRCCSCCPSRTPPWSSSRTCTGSSRTGR